MKSLGLLAGKLRKPSEGRVEVEAGEGWMKDRDPPLGKWGLGAHLQKGCAPEDKQEERERKTSLRFGEKTSLEIESRQFEISGAG